MPKFKNLNTEQERAGFRRFLRGGSEDDNPHPQGSKDRGLWEDGFRLAASIFLNPEPWKHS